jgi:hypothetical protein
MFFISLSARQTPIEAYSENDKEKRQNLFKNRILLVDKV